MALCVFSEAAASSAKSSCSISKAVLVCLLYGAGWKYLVVFKFSIFSALGFCVKSAASIASMPVEVADDCKF
jgi:hypothetical protein